jgi:hypothetical protein
MVAGKVEISLTKATEVLDIKTKSMTVAALEKMTSSTKEYSLAASSTVKIKSPKIAIGKDGVELLDQIVKAIDKLGAVKPISPVGPCTPLMATPEWAEVSAIKAKIEQIKGSL